MSRTHMPAVLLYDFALEPWAGAMEYSARELLHDTDPYEFLLEQHFTSSGARAPRVMHALAPDESGGITVFLWDARRVSL